VIDERVGDAAIERPARAFGLDLMSYLHGDSSTACTIMEPRLAGLSNGRQLASRSQDGAFS
jgi:hypothetical protein